jgi:phosphoglycolate phosphatase-like HAD superfamily hydrolase
VVAAPWVLGAQEFLEEHRKRYQFFVVSATPDTEIKEIISRKGMQNFFSAVLGSPRKKAELPKELLQTFHYKTDELVYVGDAVNDWQAANRAGVSFIWRRTSAKCPMLPDYTGPWIYTLNTLPESLSLL